MRYYKIEIDGGPTYQSFDGNQNLPGALNVEFDIPVVDASTPIGLASVVIWGVGLEAISQASDLINKKIKVSGGMQRGLPLANPAQSGVLVQGYIFQAFGNREGVNQTLNLLIQAGDPPATAADRTKPKNLVLNWQKDTPLATALKNALQTAFSGFTIDMNISDRLKLGHDEPSFYENLEQISAYVRTVSRNIIKDTNYQGVRMYVREKTISVYDGSQSNGEVVQIQYQDLIGQPTWIESPYIYYKTVMRADLRVGKDTKLPQTQTTNTASAASTFQNQKVAFQGNFQIATLRHLGNFRQPDASSWVTVVTAYPAAQVGN